jgi:hypothetical protein
MWALQWNTGKIGFATHGYAEAVGKRVIARSHLIVLPYVVELTSE